MADTILPKPDETAAPKPTFEPAPVPTPAPSASSPAPAATPSAAGLAAPGAQPASQSTAPGANGLAGVNPTVAGNTPSANAKDAINTLATPAPLPTEAQKPPAAPAAAQPGAAPAQTTTAPKAPSGGSGAGQAGSTATTAKTTAPKTGTAATLDTLAPVNDTISKMLEGNDPIAAIQYNQILNGSGPKNQAMLQGLGMKLRQSNLDGQGAGDALLAMMARDAEYNADQLRAQVSAESAKRLYDMNLHGFDKAIEIQQERDRLLRSDLSSALQNGQFDAAKELFGQVFPGVPFDEAAAKAASPQATANFNSRMKLVDQFVSQGNAAQAKEMMDRLAQDMPEMFGFPNDPQAAKTAVAGIDFSTEAWQNNLKAQNDASAAARVAALQGDQTGLSSAIDQLFSKMTPSAVEAIASSAAKSRSLDEINQILQASGMAPVASTDEAALLDKAKFAKAVKAYDLMQSSKRDVVDGLLDTFAKADPAIAIDPTARQAAKAWLAMHAYGIATDPNSGAVTNFTLDDKATPPWDPTSAQAYLFMDWPVASFNPDGSVAQRSYNGLTPYSQDYKPGDLTTAKGKEDARLDKAYEQYVFSTPSDKRLDMEKWYYATAGGTKPASESLLTGSLAKPAEPKADPMVSAQDVSAKIAKGEALTPADIEIAKTQKLIPAATSAKGAMTTGSTDVANYLKQHPDGNMLLDGKLVQLVAGGHYTTNYGGDYGTKHRDYSQIRYNGKDYWVDSQGYWYAQNPVSYERNLEFSGGGSKAIPNPLSA